MAADGVQIAHRRLQPLGHQLEYLVADLVSEGVVDLLEMIQVDEQHRHARAVAPGHGEGVVHAVKRQCPVGGVGQRVALAGKRQRIQAVDGVLGNGFGTQYRLHQLTVGLAHLGAEAAVDVAPRVGQCLAKFQQILTRGFGFLVEPGQHRGRLRQVRMFIDRAGIAVAQGL